jgi:hypothetical protein
MTLDRYIDSELGREKMSILNRLKDLGRRFVILNVFTDTKDNEVRKKIKEASKENLRDGGIGLHM